MKIPLAFVAVVAAAAGWAPHVSGQSAPPLRIPDGVSVVHDVPYAGNDNADQRLDIYLPKSRRSQAPLPLVVFIHGGAWKMGDKASVAGSGGPSGAASVLAMVASGNYAGASINYRLVQEAIWPAQIHDCKAAIRWLRANAGNYKIDSQRIGVTGTSAGGQLVAMLGVSGGNADLEGKVGEYGNVSSRVACVADQFGPIDARMVGEPLGLDAQEAPKASPLTYVNKGASPFLLVHGTSDPGVSIHQSEMLYDALKKAGVEVNFIRVIDGGHGGFRAPEVGRRIQQFFDKHLRGQDVKIIDEAIPNGGDGGPVR